MKTSRSECERKGGGGQRAASAGASPPALATHLNARHWLTHAHTCFLILLAAVAIVVRYRAHWRFASEQLVFLASFTHWLETHQLINMHDATNIIGGELQRRGHALAELRKSHATERHGCMAGRLTALSPCPLVCPAGFNETYAVPSVSSDASAAGAASTPLPAGVGLDVDDYLQGLTALPKELCRLCVNCVRSGNYTLPVQISVFISDLYSGLRMLNLRNDALRRKFDAVK